MSRLGAGRELVGQADGAGEVVRVEPPSPAEFDESFRGRAPVILKHGIVDWHALARWTPDGLKARFGHCPVNPYVACTGRTFSQGADFRDRVTERTMMFSAFISQVFGEPEGGDVSDEHQSGNVYLRLRFSDEPFADLVRDVRTPHIFGSDVDKSSSGVWIGQRGNRTPLHNDPWHGLLGQVMGRKRVWLFPVEYSPTLRRLKSDIRQHAFGFPEALDDFPALRTLSLTSCILEDGEILYIPPGWWHEVLSLDSNISVVLRFNMTQGEAAELLQVWSS